MGLLESLVNTPERLRVWHLSGVRYFLLPEGGAVRSAAPSAEAPADAGEPASWPASWSRLFAKTPRQPRLCLCYAALGLDLTGRADRRRGPLWRRLIAALGLAGRGLVAFWPLALPDGEALVPAPAVFRAGLSRLAPDVLAFFGDPAACGLPLDGTGPTATVAGIPCVVLPDPAVLLDGDPEVWNHVLAALGHVAISG